MLRESLEGVRDLQPLRAQHVELPAQDLGLLTKPGVLLGEGFEPVLRRGRPLQALEREPEEMLAVLHPAYEVRGRICSHDRV